MAKTPISGLFGTSPVKPLQRHMASAQTCVDHLLPFIDAVLGKNWEEASSQRNKISELEREADKLKRDLRLHLPNSLLMPVSRRDLLEVLTMQDMVANKAKDIAGLVLGRKMEFPGSLGSEIRTFVERSIDASAQAQKAINELDELVEAGFRGNEVETVESMIQELDNIEQDTDRIQVKVRSMLREFEDSLPPINVIFMYKVIDSIGELADRAQQVGSRLELLLAR